MRPLIISIIFVAGCASPNLPTVEQVGGMSHVIVLNEGILVGPEPSTAHDLASLHERGVRSIISVDALPTIDGLPHFARVHLPLKYDGISESEQASLAKAIKVLPPKVYVHCQHGVHRAPAAASVGLIGLERMTVEQGIQVLTLAGTSPDYPGLWSVVELMKPLQASTVERLAVNPLPKVSEVSDQAALMADVDRIFEDIKSGLRDKQPVAAEGAFLRDVLRQLALGAESSELQTGFAKASLLAARVEEAIRKRDHVATQEALLRLGEACNVCHRSHRDIVD